MLEYERTTGDSRPECMVSAGQHLAETTFYLNETTNPAAGSTPVHRWLPQSQVTTLQLSSYRRRVLLVSFKQTRPSTAAQARMMGALHIFCPSMLQTGCLSGELPHGTFQGTVDRAVRARDDPPYNIL